MYITSSGPESSPRISFSVNSGSWYNLTSKVSGTRVKIYVNDNLVKEITMSGSGADSKSNNFVGLWCHNQIPIKGDAFKGKSGLRQSYKLSEGCIGFKSLIYKYNSCTKRGVKTAIPTLLNNPSFSTRKNNSMHEDDVYFIPVLK